MSSVSKNQHAEDQPPKHVNIPLARFVLVKKFSKGLPQALHVEQLGSHQDLPKSVVYDICRDFKKLLPPKHITNLV